jgi:LDH2 family malate/lactate/ureidoglycolate dehydrogenase
MSAPAAPGQPVRVAAADLVAFTTRVFTARGVPADRAATAADALCYGDLTGLSSHGLANLTRLYLPLFGSGRVDPGAEPRVLSDLGAAMLLDAERALGLWAASEAMDRAVDRAGRFGVGMVSVRGATHFGCAGYHAVRAVRRGMVGVVAANCGQQRIARPPGGRVAMLGTNPVSIAAPAGDHHPFVLDMSTTAVPTGRIRAAAREGRPVPPGWLADDDGNPVTDPAAFDRGAAHLLWLGGSPETGSYKGFGLGLTVEVLAGLVSGAGLGPAPEALTGDGTPSGRDDDIGYLVLAIAPGLLREGTALDRDAGALFGSLLACPPARAGAPVRYPGWHEAERARENAERGVPLPESLWWELRDLARTLGLPAPATVQPPAEPMVGPAVMPLAAPILGLTAEPTPEPLTAQTAEPTPGPSAEPTAEPLATRTAEPPAEPTGDKAGDPGPR